MNSLPLAAVSALPDPTGGSYLEGSLPAFAAFANGVVSQYGIPILVAFSNVAGDVFAATGAEPLGW